MWMKSTVSESETAARCFSLVTAMAKMFEKGRETSVFVRVEGLG